MAAAVPRAFHLPPQTSQMNEFIACRPAPQERLRKTFVVAKRNDIGYEFGSAKRKKEHRRGMNGGTSLSSLFSVDLQGNQPLEVITTYPVIAAGG